MTVRAATELTCSLGVASSKVVAKIASDRRKPAGLTVVPAGRERAFLAPFDVRLLPGVGPRRPEHLEPALAALELELSPEERDSLAALFDP